MKKVLTYLGLILAACLVLVACASNKPAEKKKATPTPTERAKADATVLIDTTNNKKRAATGVTTLLVQKSFPYCLTSNAINSIFPYLMTYCLNRYCLQVDNLINSYGYVQRKRLCFLIHHGQPRLRQALYNLL